jgi:hypothetical protein
MIVGFRLAALSSAILDLPFYSCHLIAPNLNPIEMAFAKLKGLLGASAVRTIDALWRVIKQIGDIFSS